MLCMVTCSRHIHSLTNKQRNFPTSHPPNPAPYITTTFLSTLNMDTKTLSPTSSGRITRNSVCNSPEFEFWMVRNPSFPQPKILSADELFVNGVLLPLHLLNKPDPHPETHPDTDPEPDPSPTITDSSSVATLSSSKRWKDIFRKSDKKNTENNNNAEESEKDKEKGKKKEKKSGATTSAELNINIWPFSRSRSAGNAGTRPKLFPGAPVTRKVNSAPCSRSNSAGESKSRKWPSSPGRAGVHLGRSSPVWQVRRPKNPTLPLSTESHLKGSKRETAIGYRHHLSCRSDENSAFRVSGGSHNRGSNRAHANVGNAGKLFNLRSLFSKKSVVTSH